MEENAFIEVEGTEGSVGIMGSAKEKEGEVMIRKVEWVLGVVRKCTSW